MQASFAEKSAVYHDAETKWRSRAFQIAVTLGILPVLAGVTQLMPRDFSPWITLFISILNVIVVVTNVKLDIGERIADASMASKSFGKLAMQIDLFFCELKCSPEQSDPSAILTVIRTVLDTIDSNLSYPEMPKGGSKSKVVPSSVPGGSSSNGSMGGSSSNGSNGSKKVPSAMIPPQPQLPSLPTDLPLPPELPLPPDDEDLPQQLR
jgi:hypothetical protein